MMEEGTRKLNPHAPPFYPRRVTPVVDPPPPDPSTDFVRLVPVPTGPRSRGGRFRGAATSRRVVDVGGNSRRDGGKQWLKRRPAYRQIMPLKPDETSTSVMIRNIPNNYTRELLVEFLENHCKKENEKDENSSKIRSAFDFVYLPVDFKHRLNAGYAFVNFTSSEAAWRFHESVKGKLWDLFDSKKIADITRAKIQGKEALIRNFERMQLCSPSWEYLPVWFEPPIDGCILSSSSSTKMHAIGVVEN